MMLQQGLLPFSSVKHQFPSTFQKNGGNHTKCSIPLELCTLFEKKNKLEGLVMLI